MFTKDLLKSLVKLINFITSKKKMYLVKKSIKTNNEPSQKKNNNNNNEQLYMIKYQLQKLKHP